MFDKFLNKGFRGARGFRGERGERGSTGERGAERGPVGKQGPKGAQGESGEHLTKRVTWSFVAVFLLTGFFLTAFAVEIKSNRDTSQKAKELARQGQEAHATLCVLRTDYAKRVAASEKFLKENPGPVIIGIPRKTIEVSAANQKATLDALDQKLDCGKSKK